MKTKPAIKQFSNQMASNIVKLAILVIIIFIIGSKVLSIILKFLNESRDYMKKKTGIYGIKDEYEKGYNLNMNKGIYDKKDMDLYFTSLSRKYGEQNNISKIRKINNFIDKSVINKSYDDYGS